MRNQDDAIKDIPAWKKARLLHYASLCDRISTLARDMVDGDELATYQSELCYCLDRVFNNSSSSPWIPRIEELSKIYSPGDAA